MKATFKRERAHDLWAEITPLLEMHWIEIAHYLDIPLAPDVEGYCRAEDAGLLRCYTARIDSKLVGYAVFWVKHNMHYMGSVQALQDVLFLLPEHREGRTGLALIAYCDEELAAEGVQVIYQHVKKAHDFGAILLRRGYELVETVYGKRTR
jgi:hypothetical protein